jgi:rare lipoprotein A (peptidoglycan hydrolase)
MKKIIAVFSFNLFIAVFAIAQSQPLTENSGFHQEGLASWYGAEFAGRPTASGEIFDPSQMTAAHLTLPFGTILTVTNLSNNTQVQVKVNDRGPFVKSRIIDVSRAAAETLGIVDSGTAEVRIEVVPRSSALAANTTAPAPIAALPSTSSIVIDEAPDYFPLPNPSSELAENSGEYPVTAQAAAPVIGTAATPTQIQPVRTPTITPPTMVPPTIAPAPAASPPALTLNQNVQGPYQPLPPSATTRAQAPAPASPANPVSPVVTSPVTTSPATTSPVITTRAPVAPIIPAPANQNARNSIAEIRGGPVVPGRIYRLQIGSFKLPKNAVETFERLSNAGLSPSWENFEGYYRIVLTNIKAEDVPSIAAKLGSAGFKEAIARLEG